MSEGDFRFKPGDSIAAMLAWGDVDVAATGAVTAVSRDGRFIAFGHPFLKRGRAAYPAARAYVHEVVLNQALFSGRAWTTGPSMFVSGTVIQPMMSVIPLYVEALRLNQNHEKSKINLGKMYLEMNPPDVDTALKFWRAGPLRPSYAASCFHACKPA